MKLILSALLPLQLFLITPLSLFLSNADEMKAGFLAVFKLALLPFLACFLVFFLLFRLLPDGLNRVLQLLVVTLATGFWIQSNLVAWDYGVLDGQLIDWASYSFRGWIDAGIWVSVIFVIVFIAKNRISHVVQFLGLVLAIQSMVVVVQAANHPESFVEEVTYDSHDDLDSLSRFSSKTNVLHLVIDGFQSDVLDYLVNQSQIGERYSEALDGFTYYPETLGVFPFTRFSVPAFLSGNVYQNDTPKTQFIDEVLGGPNLLNQSRKQGYDLDVGSGARYWVRRYASANTSNIYGLDNNTKSNPAQLQTAQLVDLAIFRSLPHFLKPLAYGGQDWLLSRIVRSSASVRHWYFLHTLFLNGVAENLKVDREKPVYKYFHVMNTHNPMVVDAECQYLGHIVGMTRATLTYQTKCTLDTLATLFESMRANNVYDNTLIIMHGDHGGWVPNLRQGPVPRFGDGTELDWTFVSLSSPLLAIKPIGSRTPFQQSGKLVSLLQVADTVRTELGWPGDYGYQAIRDQEEGSNPTRTFRVYRWQRDAWETDYTGPIYEFDITGSHYEAEWKHTSTVLPPD